MNQYQAIFKNTAVLALSRLAERISSMVLIFFISRTLFAAGLGIYSTAIAFYGLIAVAAELGSTNLLVREIAKDLSRTNRYVLHLSVMSTAAAAAATLLGLLVVPFLGYTRDLAAAVFLIILALIPGTLNTIQEAVFVAHQRVEYVTYTTLAASAVTVGVSIGLLLTGHDVVSLVIVFVAVRYLVLICYFYLINRYIARLHWEFQFAFARSLLHDMKYFAASSLLAALFARPEIIILSLVSTPVQVGLYSAALKLVDLWQIIPETFMINVFPVLSRAFARADGEPQFIQDKSVKYLLAVALPLGVGMAVAADPIITLLYGPGFEPAVPLLQVLACTIPLYSLNGVLWRVLAARGRQNLVLRVQVITTVTRLAGGVLVIAWLTALGAALITTANLLLYNLLLTPYLRRAGLRLAPWRLSWRFALAAGGMGALLWVGGPYLALWALVPLAALVYGALVVLLKGFAPDDYALLRRVWRPRAAGP